MHDHYWQDHASIWHCYGGMAPQRQWGHKFDLLGSRDMMTSVARLMLSDRWCCRHRYLRNYKAVKWIHEKIMRARSTLD